MAALALGHEGIVAHLVGEFEVVRGGRTLPGTLVGSRKARTLIKLLAVERDRWVLLDRIVDVLWEGQAPLRPADNVATLVSRVRAALGEAVIMGDRDGYRLGNRPAVDVDLAIAERDVAQAKQRFAAGEMALVMSAATRALSILGDGNILVTDADAAWIEPARTQCGSLAREARGLLAAAALEVGEPATSRALAAEAIAADPFDEGAHRLAMRAEVSLGEPARALASYELLRRRLSDELGIDPAAETRELHQSILREEPLPAAVKAARPIMATVTSTLAGRDNVMALLARRWSAAVAGTPAFVLITGEAGIGKTTLAAAIAETAASTGGTVMRARCYEAERSLYLQPVVDALGEHAATSPPATILAAAGDWGGPVASLVPQIAAIIGPVTVQHDRGEVARRRSYDAFSRYVCGIAAAPLLVMLDDLHLAGLATVELLHFLIRRAANARLLIVATVRSEDGGATIEALSDVAERIELGPLPPEAVSRLATAAGHAELAASILARTGGHTLFVVETLHALAAGDPGIPESLQAAVLARVQRAGEQTAGVLRAAAVLGANIEPDTLARMLDISPIIATERCEQALAARLLVVAERAYEFANDLIREVLYANVPAPSRVAYHRRAADLLSDRPEAVGAHASAAGDWARAARGWLLAGEQAGARVAFADAEALLTYAIAASEHDGDREVGGRAYLARGRVRDAMMKYPEALRDLETAAGLAREAGDQRLEMTTLRELAGDVPIALGLAIATCAANLHRGLRLAQGLGDRAFEADVLGRLAVIDSNRLRFATAVTYGEHALQAARTCGDERAVAAALDGLKTAYAYMGEIDLLQPILAELEPLLRRQGDAWRLPWAVQEGAFPAIAAGRFDEALDRLSIALDLNRRSGYVAYEGFFVGFIGWVHRLRGDLDEASAYGRRAVDLTCGSTHAWWRAAACTQYAGTLLAAGDVPAAIDLLGIGREYASRNGAESYLLNCLGPIAAVTGDRAVLDEADALLSAIEVPDGCAWMLGAEAYLSIARAWLAADQPAKARATVAPLLSAATRIGWVWVRDEAADIEVTAAQRGAPPPELLPDSRPAGRRPADRSRQR